MLALFLGLALIIGYGGKAETDKHQKCKEINFKNEFCKDNKKLEKLKDFSLHR
jgi:hypothetical protein